MQTDLRSSVISNRDGISPEVLSDFIAELSIDIKAKKIAIVAPDYSRLASQSGIIADALLRHFGERIAAILPALGTHVAMSKEEKREVFSTFSPNQFIDHDFLNNVNHVGTIPKGDVEEATEIDDLYELPFYVNSSLIDGSFDLLISVAQLLPHEVIGISGGSKNILIGLGGRPTIEVSHYVSALWGIERTLGNPETPLRRLLNRGLEMLLQKSPPILFLNTVLNPNKQADRRLIHIGAGLVTKDQPIDSTFASAAQVAVETNIFDLKAKFNEVIAYLEPKIYRSTWIGNKAIYRSRLLIADNATLRVVAPGVDRFGEDPSIDDTLRRYGYRGYEAIRQMKVDGALDGNLAAAAHILHSSTFDRFKVEYVAPKLGREEMEAVGFLYGEGDAISGGQSQPSHDGEEDVLYEVDDDGRLHIYHPGVALWREGKQ